jgi:micrococcal nuclease
MSRSTFLWRLELLLVLTPLTWVVLSSPPPGTRPSYRCVRVVDGDTIILKLPEGRRSCRLIGVDTPETVHPNKAVEWYGREASAFLKKLVEGKDVRIANNGPRPTFDKYHRRLVYVYLDGPPTVFVNREILARGYGRLFESQRFIYKNEFRLAQERARRAGLGLWASSSQSDW